MQLFCGGDEFAKKKDIVNPNLFTGSKDFTGSKWINLSENLQKDKYLDFTAIYNNWSWNGISQYIAVNKGETFTFSAYAKAKADSPLNLFMTLNQDGEGGYKKVDTNPNGISIMATGDWQKVSVTSTMLDSGAIKPRLEGDGSSPFWVAGMKLERGAVATPWRPALEDYAAKSDIQNLKQTMLKCVPHVNLLKNSAGPFFPQPQANPDTSTYYAQTDVNAIDQWQVFLKSTVTLIKGETYTLSAATNGVFSNTHDPSTASNKCVIWIGLPANIVISGENTSANTFTWDSDTGTYPLRVNRYGKDSTVKCWNVKIEHGSQATDWTPCPLDS